MSGAAHSTRNAFALATIASVMLLVSLSVAQTKSTHVASKDAANSSTAGTKKPTQPKAKTAQVKPAVDTAKCETCHSAIANTKDGDSRHPAMEMGCDGCHVTHATPNPVATKENPKFLKKTAPELCADCHDLKERSALKFQHAVANDCTTCHNPHSSPNPKMLVDKQPALCETCHSAQAEAHQKDKFLHKPVFETGCSTCHDPHASANEHQLRAQGNALCLECHAQKAGAANATDAKTLSLFGGGVQLPPDYLIDVRRIAVTTTQAKGHPTANHPVSGVRDVAMTKKPLQCTTCHSPHSSTGSPQFFVTGKKSPSQLCIRCHQ